MVLYKFVYYYYYYYYFNTELAYCALVVKYKTTIANVKMFFLIFGFYQ